jgi:hypothetical protein
MTDQPSAFETMVIASLRMQLANAKDAAAEVAERDAATIAKLRAMLQNLGELAEADHNQLKAERDSLRSAMEGWRHCAGETLSEVALLRGLRDATDPEPALVAAARAMWDSCNVGFIRCWHCGDQESTSDIDGMQELGVALVAYDTTDPGPALVAQTREALGEQALDARTMVAMKQRPTWWTDTYGQMCDISCLVALPPWFDKANAELDAHLAADDGSDAHEPDAANSINPVDLIVDALGKRMMPLPDRIRLGKALDAANVPDASDKRAAQDAAVGKAAR